MIYLGKQQCMGGVDEDYCELLEFNECENDEYRCANGMCISEEYWLDSDYDCMDYTDEVNTIVGSGYLCFSIPTLLCGEHLCPYNQWSCGDGELSISISSRMTISFLKCVIGQCVNYDADRYEGLLNGPNHFCLSMRDIQYMCESVTRNSQPWWTIDGGYCLPFRLQYQTLDLDKTKTKDLCSFHVKCALSGSLDQNCTCKSVSECRDLIMRSCKNSTIQYPASGPLISPFVYMFYKRDSDWTERNIWIFRFVGRVKCLGYQLIRKSPLLIATNNDVAFYLNAIFENAFCTEPEDVLDYRNYSGVNYDRNCWNNSKTFNNRSYQVSSQCRIRCVSKYRIRDGIPDCVDPSEEYKNMNASCPQIQRHRFRCSSTELTCFLAAALLDFVPWCSNKRDAIDYESGLVLFGHVDCATRDDFGCIYLRDYIERSSAENVDQTILTNNSMLNDHTTTWIPFRSYCDSFFHTKSGFDETTEFCQNWICSMDEYQCLSGQCIPVTWICDGNSLFFTTVI